MLIMNCLDKDQTVMAGGNHFHFKAKQIKHFYQENIANFIARDKKEFGFVAIPDELEDPESRTTPEGKAIIEAKRVEGVEAYCARLKAIVYNLQVSLKRDLDMKNIKADPRVFATKGEMDALQELVTYQNKHEDADQSRIDKFKELEKQLAQKV